MQWGKWHRRRRVMGRLWVGVWLGKQKTSAILTARTSYKEWVNKVLEDGKACTREKRALQSPEAVTTGNSCLLTQGLGNTESRIEWIEPGHLEKVFLEGGSRPLRRRGPCWLLLVPVGVGLSLGRVGDDWPSGGSVASGHVKAASESIARVCPLKGAAELAWHCHCRVQQANRHGQVSSPLRLPSSFPLAPPVGEFNREPSGMGKCSSQRCSLWQGKGEWNGGVGVETETELLRKQHRMGGAILYWMSLGPTPSCVRDVLVIVLCAWLCFSIIHCTINPFKGQADCYLYDHKVLSDWKNKGMDDPFNIMLLFS